jgi:methylated-DNA-[protein]-cysteine S-methyltransferase
MMQRTLFNSPGGGVELRGEQGRLAQVRLLSAAQHCSGSDRPAPALAPYVRLLEEYFGGRYIETPFDEMADKGWSSFRRSVYVSLAKVPFGQLVSYAELAARAGNDGAARAVGQAVGANPFPIIIPCHRVIRTDGGVGGFSAGTEWKSYLLRHEGHHVADGCVTPAEAGRITRAGKNQSQTPRPGNIA